MASPGPQLVLHPGGGSGVMSGPGVRFCRSGPRRLVGAIASSLGRRLRLAPQRDYKRCPSKTVDALIVPWR